MTASYLFLIALSITGLCAGSQDEANSFLDRIAAFYVKKPVEWMALDPAHLPWTNFSVKHSSLPRKNVTVVMDHGILHGLSGALQRVGDCQLRQKNNQNVTVTCNATLDGLQANFRAFVQHDQLPLTTAGADYLVGLSKEERLEMEFTVKDSRALFQITAIPWSRCSLKLFSVSSMDTDVTLSREPTLEDGMKSKVFEKARSRVAEMIKDVLQSHFKDALDKASRGAYMRMD
ncbi:uncharacterized protein ISCGN_010143 [Ixodes scapularis]